MAKSRSGVPKVPPLGPRLQEARKGRDLTLEQLADLSGISKSMLSQIERGQTNPTFATLWNICHALGLEIANLIGSGQPADEPSDGRIESMRAHYTPTLRSADAKCVLRIISPVTTASRVEWYQLDMKRGAKLDSDPHSPGTAEHLTCLDGTLRVTSGTAKHVLGKGDTARYRGDLKHAIENIGKADASALLVVLYRQ